MPLRCVLRFCWTREVSSLARYSDVNALSALNLANVRVADYRLLQEHEFEDAVEDVHNAYLYLISERQLPAESMFL
jgi:acetyl esterase/lipase